MILDEVGWAVQRCRHVSIDERRLQAVCAALPADQLRLPDWRIPIVPSSRDERLVDWILLFNSINFCYWGEPKWTVVFRGQPYDGAYGMMASLTRALEEGIPLLDGDFLAHVDTEQFGRIFRGSVPIPLASERLAIWHETGPTLVREYGGHWHEVVQQASGSALQLVRLLVERFPSFDDSAEFEGRRIPFYKRAQLCPGMLCQAFGGAGWGAFADFDQLTVYADYKLPRVLRRLGVLAYDPDLARLIDSCTWLPAGSRMEVEIRVATVWAGELMRRELLSSMPWVTASHIDFWLWEAGQQKLPDDRPYHRTLTTAY